MLNRLLVALAVVVGISSYANAQLPEPDKTQALNQVKSIHDATKGAYYLGLHLGAHPEDVASVYSLTQNLLDVKRNHMSGLLYLLDMDGGSNVINGMTRAQARDAGIATISGASYAQVITGIQSLASSCVVSCGNLNTARIEVTSAENLRASFNSGLPYLEPRVRENVAFPGATREMSANAGPHGDYRRFGKMTQNREDSIRSKWLSDLSAAVRNPAYIPQYIANLAHHDKTGRFNVVGLGLIAGLEHPLTVPHLDVMEAGGTTQRGRHFFRILLMQEMYIGLDHLDNQIYTYSKDVFGRTVFRGNTYQLERQLRETANFLCGSPDVPPWVCDAIQSMRWAGEEWADMDNQAWNGIVLRFFTNIGRPAQTSGVCDLTTTAIQMVDGRPTCVGVAVGGGLSCGVGTHPEGSVCIADACPPQGVEFLGIDSVGRVSARCTIN